VRHVTLRPGFFESPEFADATMRAFASSPDVAEHRQFGMSAQQMDVFLLREPFAPLADLSRVPWRVVPPDTLNVDASDRADRARYALDGDAGTRWISGT